MFPQGTRNSSSILRCSLRYLQPKECSNKIYNRIFKFYNIPLSITCYTDCNYCKTMQPNTQPTAPPTQAAPDKTGVEYGRILSSAKKSGDTLVLTITLLISGFLLFLLFEGTALEIFITAIAALLVSLIYVRLMQVRFLGNALRIQNGRHAYLLNIVQEISTNLRMPVVDVYITQDPYLNAFAVGYTHPYTIVLHSAMVEELSAQELRAVLIHEMAHIKYKHTVILAYIQPLSVLVPVLGPAIGWLFGFWGRRAELACDRLALAYTHDPHTVIMALIKIHVGSKFAAYMTEEGVLYQEKMTKSTSKLLSQSLETHPFLITRVHEIRWFAEKLGLLNQSPSTTPAQQA